MKENEEKVELHWAGRLEVSLLIQRQLSNSVVILMFKLNNININLTFAICFAYFHPHLIFISHY